jgi:spermidine synthase
VVVAVVLLTPVTFRLVGEAYRGAYPSLSSAPLGLALVRFALSVLGLAPATVLMGATLPTLTRYLASGPAGLEGAFRRLYAANTVGAIAGTLLAGLVLIELLGLTGTLVVGAACSASAGVVALLLDRRTGPSLTGGVPDLAGAVAGEVVDAGAVANPAPARGSSATDTDAARERRRRRRLALTLAFLSGLTSLGYQVVWNRLVGAGTGQSTYVFTVILALFLVGIAAGARMLGQLRVRATSVLVLIGLAQLGTALLVILGSAAIWSAQGPMLGGTVAFLPGLLRFAAATTFVVLPATTLMGITFPATAALMGEAAGGEGAASGSLLAANTAGAIVATFVLPFFVIPLIGSPVTLAVLALVNALLGGVLLASERLRLGRFRIQGAVAGAAVAAVVIVAMVTGVGFRNPTTTMIRAAGGTVYATTEDEIASVAAGSLAGSDQLWVGGTSMTVVTVDTKLMPLLPLMLRPGASRGLLIAFGMGTAFRGSLLAGVRTDVVELVPSVPSMFHWYYPDAPSVLANPGGRVIIADGRNHVELTAERFDFIVVDPPPPIETSGVSVISSLEFFRAAKARIVADGVMLQWVPGGQTVDEFLAQVRTFMQVFPNVRVIAGPGGNGFYLLGSDGPVDPDPATMAAVLERPGVIADVDSAADSGNRTVDEWVSTITALSWASGDTLARVVGDGPIVTDDRPLPEYFLLRRLADPGAPEVSLAELRALLP